jgi:UDP-N-acetyl-D-glucosamine dehydrogenase
MKRNNVCIIGLGYVGFPLAIALANVKKKKHFKYSVFAYDKDKKKTGQIIESIKNKKLPFKSQDHDLIKKFKNSLNTNKINIVEDFKDIKKMNTIVISIGFDFFGKKYSFRNIIELIKRISEIIKKGSLILIETTLPPGTYEKILIPEIIKTIKKRDLKLSDIHLGYSHERIMPGRSYYNSMINNYKCYSGYDKISKIKVRNFLKSFINYKKFPLIELNNITECETAKVLENSYRAINIALIDEWVNYSNLIKIDLFKVIKAIKVRPTHFNIMVPGLGVGGYCLPKDGLFAKKSAKFIYKSNISFPFIDLASKINKKMPSTALKFIESKTRLNNKKILILGTAYKENIDDERLSPAIDLINKLEKKGSLIKKFDPMINKYSMPKFSKYDIVIFCVNHKKIKDISIQLFSRKPIYFDLNNVIDEKKINFMKKKKFKLFLLGRNFG